MEITRDKFRHNVNSNSKYIPVSVVKLSLTNVAGNVLVSYAYVTGLLPVVFHLLKCFHNILRIKKILVFQNVRGTLLH